MFFFFLVYIYFLKHRQNRGYDSAGLATLNEETQQIICTKKASVDTSDSIQQLKLLVPQKHSLNDVVGIAHTRWYDCINLVINLFLSYFVY